MSNKYPSSYLLDSASIVCSCRLALIGRIDKLRDDCIHYLHTDCYQNAFDCLNEMQSIRVFIDELDEHIQFDSSDELEF